MWMKWMGALARHVLWVVGPALGHVSRCLQIADRLAAQGLDSRFAGSDLHGYHARLLHGRFAATELDCPPAAFERFADRVGALVDETQPAAVVFDASPIPWRLAMPALPVPTVQISNYFLTTGAAPTWQDARWAEHGAAWQALRRARGLPELGSARDLYEADAVLLADPPAWVPDHPPRPPHHRIVGACAWSPASPVPPALQDLADTCFVSFGSTGGQSLPDGLVDALCQAAGARRVLSLAARGIRLDGQELDTGPLPAPALLRAARVCLTHGGAGSTYQALAQGVPVAVWPAHHNHRLLGERVEALGLGVCLDPANWRAGVARLATDYVAIQARARAFAFDLDAGPRAAAQAIAAVAAPSA